LRLFVDMTLSRLSSVGVVAAAFGFASPLLQAAPLQSDIDQCEAMVKEIIAAPPSDERILSSCYTRDFSKLVRRGHEPTDNDPMPYFDACMIMDTNGMETDILRVGPGRVDGEEIRVPVTLRHIGFDGPHKPFTKTWVFVREGGTWRARDLVRNEKESLYKELEEVFGAP